MKVRPIGPWIFVKVEEPERQTKAGIYLPEGNAQERIGNATGVVLAKGKGTYTKKNKLVPIDLEVGDRIVFRGFLQEANRPGGYLDREHCLLHVNDVIGVTECECS